MYILIYVGVVLCNFIICVASCNATTIKIFNFHQAKVPQWLSVDPESKRLPFDSWLGHMPIGVVPLSWISLSLSLKVTS